LHDDLHFGVLENSLIFFKLGQDRRNKLNPPHLSGQFDSICVAVCDEFIEADCNWRMGVVVVDVTIWCEVL
jgi:hypothetical protein